MKKISLFIVLPLLIITLINRPPLFASSRSINVVSRFDGDTIKQRFLTGTNYDIVRITNIDKTFQQGIDLESGRYHVEVSADGYEKKSMWLTLDEEEDKSLKIALKRLAVVKKGKSVSKGKEIDHDEIYLELGGGVVRDNKTGLEWLTGYGWQMKWNKTKSWIEGLSLIFGGEWRMPTINELKSLYVEGYGTRNLTPLLTTTSWEIWSGKATHSDTALAFNFRYGREKSCNRNTTHVQVFAVRKGKSSVDVTHGSKEIKIVSSQESATAIHSQKADIEALPYAVKVKVGDLRKEVESIYGKPSSIKVLPRYNPPVMRQLQYKSLGLTFYFFRNLLWGIEVYAPFKGEFFGVKIGDFVSQAIALYRSKYTGSFPMSKGPPHYYEWSNILTECTLKVYVMNRRTCEEDKNPIISFSFTDYSKRGKWIPSQFLP
jgi:hypothetical protein